MVTAFRMAQVVRFQKMKEDNLKPQTAEALQKLLVELESIGKKYPEVYDLKEELHSIVHLGLLEQHPEFNYPVFVGMSTEDGNRRVIAALREYISEMIRLTAKMDLSPEERRALFEDEELSTPQGTYYDEFFGYCGIYTEGFCSDYLQMWRAQQIEQNNSGSPG